MREPKSAQLPCENQTPTTSLREPNPHNLPARTKPPQPPRENQTPTTSLKEPNPHSFSKRTINQHQVFWVQKKGGSFFTAPIYLCPIKNAACGKVYDLLSTKFINASFSISPLLTVSLAALETAKASSLSLSPKKAGIEVIITL